MRVAGICVLVVLVAGCGGGGGRLSASEFRSKADAICGRYDAQIKRASAGINGSDPKVIAAALDKVIPLVEEGEGKLRELKPPAELQSDWDRWLKLGDEQIPIAKKLRDAAKTSDEASFTKAIQQLTANENAQDQLAKGKLGLTVCGKSG
jgi:hypothetical protein